MTVSPVRAQTENTKTELEIQCLMDDTNSMLTLDHNFLTAKPQKLEICTSRNLSFNEAKSAGESDIVDDLKEENRTLKLKLNQTREKLLKCEQKSHEYYEIYHKLLADKQKNDSERLGLIKENTHIKNQIKSLQKLIEKNNKKISENSLKDVCEFEIIDVNLDRNFIVKSTQVTENSDDEAVSEVSEKFINLPIKQSILNSMGEYSNYLRSSLQYSSDLSINHTVSNLRNQVLQYFLLRAEIINNDLVLALNIMTCKHSLLKEKLKVKNYSLRSLNSRVETLEEVLTYLHHSYTKLIKHYSQIEQEYWNRDPVKSKFIKPLLRSPANLNSSEPKTQEESVQAWEAESQVYIYRNYNKELKMGIDAARTEVKNYKGAIGSIADQLKLSHDFHQRKIKAIIIEYKNNCQEELSRRQEEISRLHEILSSWISEFMAVQKFSGPKPLKHSASDSRVFRSLCEKTALATRGKIRPKLVSDLQGDQSPPVCEDI